MAQHESDTRRLLRLALESIELLKDENRRLRAYLADRDDQAAAVRRWKASDDAQK